jgi:hypothetical protein
VPRIATGCDSDEDTYTDATKWTFDAQPNCDWFGSGHQAENRIANLRCAARLAGLAPGTSKVMTRVFYSATLRFFPEVVSNQANRAIHFDADSDEEVKSPPSKESLKPGSAPG